MHNAMTTICHKLKTQPIYCVCRMAVHIRIQCLVGNSIQYNNEPCTHLQPIVEVELVLPRCVSPRTLVTLSHALHFLLLSFKLDRTRCHRLPWSDSSLCLWYWVYWLWFISFIKKKEEEMMKQLLLPKVKKQICKLYNNKKKKNLELYLI